MTLNTVISAYPLAIIGCDLKSFLEVKYIFSAKSNSLIKGYLVMFVRCVVLPFSKVSNILFKAQK